MGRIIGLDIGQRRIGVAISSPDGGLAVPLKIIDRRDDQSTGQEISELANAEGARVVVVGHPISMDGTIGPQARRVEAFARVLERTSGLAVELSDERLSTAQAKRGTPQRAKRRQPIDDLAAANILQAYLDRRRAASQIDP